MKKILLISTFMLGTLSIAFSQSILFSENFESSSSLPSGWTQINNDNNTLHTDAQSIMGSNGYVAYDWGTNSCAMSTNYFTANQYADDWLITPAITLQPNSKLKFKVRLTEIDGATPPWDDASFSVKVSTTGNAISDFSGANIFATTSFDNTGWQILEFDLSSYSGTVYVAFQNQSHYDYDPDFGVSPGGYLQFDDIEVSYLLPVDVGVIAVTGPVNGCELSSSENLQVQIKNFGSQTITSLTVAATVNGILIPEETITGITLASEATMLYTFTGEANFSSEQDYIVNAYTTLTGDLATSNNETTTTISKYEPIDPSNNSWLMDFNPSEATDQLILIPSGSAYQWEIATINNNQVLEFFGLADPVNEWMLTSCFNLEQGQNYKLKFWAENSAVAYTLKVNYANQRTVSALQSGVSIFDQALAPNSTLTYDIPFTVPATGTYYFGFNVYGASDMDYLSLDNIHIGIENDVAVSAITSPESDCNLGMETVTATLLNTGMEPASNINLAYNLDGTIFNGTYTGTIAPGASASYSFTDLGNFTAIGNHQLSAYVIGFDNNQTNDTIIKTVEHTLIPSSSFSVTATVNIGEISTITYTGCALANAQYDWNFDGASTNPSGQGPHAVSWGTAGTKYVTLTVTENGVISAQTTHPVIVLAEGSDECTDTLLYENFNGIDGPSGSSEDITILEDNGWIMLDEDGIPSQNPNLGQFWTIPNRWPGEGSDTTHECIVSQSWLAQAGTNRNWLILPEVTIYSECTTLKWKSAPLTGPKYMDGYQVLVLPSDQMDSDPNTIISLADTVASFAQYISGGTDSSTFVYSPGIRHQNFDFNGITNGLENHQWYGLFADYEVNLSQYIEQSIRIIFLHDSHDDNILGLDDIRVMGDFSAGIEENTASENIITVYPNPGTGIFNVTMNNIQSDNTIEVLDITGKIIRTINNASSNSQIDISDERNGIYFLRIYSENHSEYLKIIKH